MKINIGCTDGVLENYTNIDIRQVQLPEHWSGSFSMIDYRNLDELCEDDTVSELRANFVLNEMSPDQSMHALSSWKNKLKTKADIFVIFSDARILSELFYLNIVSVKDFHNGIFGPHNNYQSICDTDMMVQALNSVGFKIQNISSDKAVVTIHAKK